MKNIMIFVALLGMGKAYCQITDWSRCSHWKLYDVYDENVFHYSLDTLKHFKSTPMPEDSIKSLLDSVVARPPDSTARIEGLYIASCDDGQGKTMLAFISIYGGFIIDARTKTYYYVPANMTFRWIDFFHNTSIQLLE